MKPTFFFAVIVLVFLAYSSLLHRLEAQVAPERGLSPPWKQVVIAQIR